MTAANAGHELDVRPPEQAISGWRVFAGFFGGKGVGVNGHVFFSIGSSVLTCTVEQKRLGISQAVGP